MTGVTAAPEGADGLIQCPQMPGPDMPGVPPEIGQRGRFVEQEFRQSTVSLAQIAGGTGSHYVAAGPITAARLRLYVIDRQHHRRELHPAVDAAPLVPLEHSLSFHDGRVS